MIPTPAVELASVADALAALVHATSAVRAAEVGQVLAIAALCDLHRVDETKLMDGCERWIDGGADGTPQIGEFIAAEIGALLGVSPASALFRIAQVLNVRHRHPALWAAVVAGEIRFYDAGRVADACAQAGLGIEACLWLDHQCALALLTQPWSRVRNQIDRWILLADPALAAERARRLAEARRVEISPITDGHCELWGRLDAADGVMFDQALNAIADTLPTDNTGTGAGQAGTPAAARMSRDRRRAAAVGILARQALGQPELPRPAELIVRIDAVASLDHSLPYSLGGRTEVANLAPLKRFAHRARTHGKLEQTEQGQLTWTSPHGYSYTVTPTGTLRIGRPPPAAYDWSKREPPHWLDQECA